MSSYIIHKAVEFKAVQAKVRKELGANTVSDLADSYALQKKYDGVMAALVIAPNEQKALSRTNEVYKSVHHIERWLSNRLNAKLAKGQGFVVLGELWTQGVPQPIISGNARRHAASPDLKLVAFDMIPLADFNAGRCDIPFNERYFGLSTFLRDLQPSDPLMLAALYNPGTYGDPLKFSADLVALGGYDGAILRKPDGLWVAGNGTTGEIIKVKDEAVISVDLRVTGVTKGKGKYASMVGTIQCAYKGKTVSVSGMSDVQRKAWADEPELIVGKIVEVHALGETPGGMLREPRMKQIRFDKEQADYE